MTEPVLVQIIGAPVACAEGVKETWRDVAAWAARQLAARFGPAVRLDYFDLFDPVCPALPAGASLPVVLVNGELLSSGGKVSLPSINRRLAAIGTGRYNAIASSSSP